MHRAPLGWLSSWLGPSAAWSLGQELHPVFMCPGYHLLPLHHSLGSTVVPILQMGTRRHSKAN